MKKIIKYNLIALLAMVFVLYSCDSEDYTGHSNLSPSSPTITVGGTGSGFTLTEANIVYTFDVTLSVAQIVDMSLYVTQIDGDATIGEDFNIVNTNSRVYIPANSTTGTLEIEVLGDEIFEAEEFFTLQIGDERTANAAIVPVEVTFTLVNYTEDALSIDMTWETDVLDAIGLDLAADEVGDLMLFIYDDLDVLVDEVDGSSFESYNGLDTLPDGDYKIATAFYSTINAGDYNAAITFDVSLHFYQVGVIDESLVFEGVITNETPCDVYKTYLATITKSGSTYTIEEAVSSSWSADEADLVGTWYGDDNWDYSSQTTTTLSGSDLQIYGLGFGWMEDYWGESITSGNPVDIVFEWNSAGGITIPNQYYITTDWAGDPYPYNIEGTGVVNTCGAYPTMVITYDLIQDGWSIAGWAGEMFIETISLDPDSKSFKTGMIEKVVNKPVR